MTTGHGVLEAYCHRKYPLRAVNISTVRVQAMRLKSNNLVPILRADSLYHREVRLSAPFDIDRTDTLHLTEDRESIVGVSVDDALSTERRGAVLLQVSSNDEAPAPRYDRADIQVTNMSLTGKFSPDGIVLWLTTLLDARPVANAAVELRDDANRVLWQGITNAEGFAEAPGWGSFGELPKAPWSAPQIWAIATKGDDMVYTASSWNRGIEPYRFDVMTDWNPQPDHVQGVIFTDRGFYRPGDAIEFKAILRTRQGGDWRTTSGTVLLAIRDAMGDRLMSDSVVLNGFGSASSQFVIPPEARLGYYSIQASMKSTDPAVREQVVAAGSFRVEAFRTGEFEVTARAAQNAYTLGDTVRCTFSARYLFGGAMKGEPVRWRIRYEPTWFTPQGWEAYACGRSTGWYGETAGPRTKLLVAKDATLDARGTLRIEAATLVGDLQATGTLVFEADVTSPSRQTLSGWATALLHPGKFYIGIATSTTFIARDNAVQYNVVTVTPEGNIVAGKSLQCRVLKREWHSIRKASPRGGFEWESEAVDSTLLTTPIVIDSLPTMLSFTPPQAGLYVIEVRGTDARGNPIVSDTYVYASGYDYVAWERTNDDRIELIADAKSYKPGDTARLIVKNPYERAVALVSVEREGILRYWKSTLVGSAPELRVLLNSTSPPNVFVSVILLQKRVVGNPTLDKEQDVGKPTFKIGYIGLPVDPRTRHLVVGVAPERNHYRPGDTVRIKLTVNAMCSTRGKRFPCTSRSRKAACCTREFV